MEKERSMTLQERKAALFGEICARLDRKCNDCMLGDSMGYELCKDWLKCSIPDDWQTAILSLDDPANWPHIFGE